MSGFDWIIYIAGLILLTELLFRRLIKLTYLAQKVLTGIRGLVPPSRQLGDGSDSRFKTVQTEDEHERKGPS